MLKQIISGAQTGADRAALDAAIAFGLPHGGYCPQGRLAENGVIPAHYQLTEIEGSYRARNKLNVAKADGTVIFYQRYLSGGTELSLAFCLQAKKPYKLLDIDSLNPTQAAAMLQRFIADFEIVVLNVAGPRHSRCPAMYEFVKQCLTKLLTPS